MKFSDATDALFRRITHDDLASALGVSVPAIRQARLAESANAYRNPPPGWEKAARQLAERQARHFQHLASQLESRETATKKK